MIFLALVCVINIYNWYNNTDLDSILRQQIITVNDLLKYETTKVLGEPMLWKSVVLLMAL